MRDKEPRLSISNERKEGKMMRGTPVLLLLTFAAMILVSCGGSSFESVMKEQLGYMKDITPVLQGINDKPSFEDAQPKIKAFLKKMEALKKKREKLGKPTEEVRKSKEIGAMAKEFEKVSGEYVRAVFRLGTIEEIEEVTRGTIEKLMGCMIY